MTDTQKFLNADQVAKQYPFTSPGAVRTAANRGKLPYRKVGGRLVFIRSELDEYFENSPGLTLEMMIKNNA